MEWEGVDWISLAQGRDKRWTAVKTILNVWVLHNVVNVLTNCGTFSVPESLFADGYYIRGCRYVEVFCG
jgi:hypothetical protein